MEPRGYTVEKSSYPTDAEPGEITLAGLVEMLDCKVEEVGQHLDRLLPMLHGKFEPGPGKPESNTVPVRGPIYNQLNRIDDRLNIILARLEDLIGVVGR